MNPVAKPAEPAESTCCTGCGHDDTPAVVELPKPSSAPVFRIATMDCAVEEGEIRRALEPLPGIRRLRFQLAARTLTIDAEARSLELALAAIRKAGYEPEPLTALRQPASPRGTPGHGAEAHSDGHGHGHDHDHDHDHDHGHALPAAAGHGPDKASLRLGAALLFALGAEALGYFAPALAGWNVAGMALAVIAIGLAGIDTYTKGLVALRRGRLNINALMTVAVTGAFLLGQWPEAAMVMALYAIAEAIEARSVDRARNAIQGLMALAPETAEVRQADGRWLAVEARQVALDSIVRIAPGARLPLDGVVSEGRSAIDQAPVTGESIPVDKAPGDPVFAGTINQTGELQVRVTALADDSTLARIIQAVEDAQGSRAPTQRFVDRFAAVYTPAVFVIALGVALLLPLLAGVAWSVAAYKALVLLVIACPCALVISTPVTVVSGLAAAARKGILVKGGSHLEQARSIKAVALDKTGTLTEGRPSLVHRQALAEGDSAAGWASLAARLAARSDHPVSKAIEAGLGAAQQDGGKANVEAFEALPGRGVQGRIDGRLYTLGNHRLMHERGLCSPAIEAAFAGHEAQGRSVTLLASDERVLALFAVADTIRPSSREAVAELKALGIATVMLTGDNASTARAIAAQAGIDDARGDLLPQDKQAAIAELQQRHGTVAMVGDGINDAPSLAQADIGFAMGGAGTDVAMEAADVVIMNDDLKRVATTIRLSRRTHAVLWQNIALALGIKAVFLLLAVFGSATMWMAVFADMGASLLVVANGLRLLRA